MTPHPLVEWLVPLLAAYMAGCLNTGYYLVRLLTGEDIRARHSLSAGARNVGRVLGPVGFLATFIGDFSKGIAVLAAAKGLPVSDNLIPWLVPLVVAGHIWPAQLRFRGGKGLATAIGACGGFFLPAPPDLDAAALLALSSAWSLVFLAHRKNLRRGAWIWIPEAKESHAVSRRNDPWD